VNPTYSAEEGMRTATNALPYTLCTRLQQGDFLLVDLKGNLANQLLETFLAWEPVLSRLTDS
jgi:hypothetical protein